jgi:hypothetical protein
MFKRILQICIIMSAFGFHIAFAQGDDMKYPAGPATVMFRQTCNAEASHLGLKDATRIIFITDCHAQRAAARTQIAQNCRQAARQKRFWGLARHKYIRKCTLETKSFIVQPRIKAPPAPVFTPTP